MREGTAKELGLSPHHLGHMRRKGLAEVIHAPPGGKAQSWRIAEPKLTFGHLLMRKRIAAGLTIEGLADITGFSVNAIGAAERDERSSFPVIIHAIFVALNLRYAEFFAELEGKPMPDRLPERGRHSYPKAVCLLKREWTGFFKGWHATSYINLRKLREFVEGRGLDWIAYCQQFDALIGGWREADSAAGEPR
jgi:transcriptional regulator with XRE-family HTH domain